MLRGMVGVGQQQPLRARAPMQIQQPHGNVQGPNMRAPLVNQQGGSLRQPNGAQQGI